MGAQPRSTAGLSRSAIAQMPPVKAPEIEDDGVFLPREPRTLAESCVSEAMMEELICKYLLAKGEALDSRDQRSNRDAFSYHRRRRSTRLKNDQVLGYVDQSAMNDYICKLTDVGRERGRRYSDFCSYFGAAPVSFKITLTVLPPKPSTIRIPSEDDLKRAFSDLLIDPEMMDKLGPAVNSGKGMFLFGYPGNGKTSIAERITAAFGKYVWIPRAIPMDRDIVRVFDPMSHEECPIEQADGIDRTEVSIDAGSESNGPTIVVGGELTMEHLEISLQSPNRNQRSPSANEKQHAACC